MTTPLTVRDVDKSLAGHRVLRAVSFECPAGSVTGLLGPNGAGKTTAVSLVAGLRRADSGTVRIFGHDSRHRNARLLSSLVPQDVSFPGSVGVATCLDLVEQQRPVSPLVPPRSELCDAFGITPLLSRRVGALSGGQHRRLALVLGLVRAPGLLVLDEATSNLDDAYRDVTWQHVRSYVAAGGAALVTTHLLADIDAHADRVVALADGRTVWQGPLDDARRRLDGTTEVSVELDSTDAFALVAMLPVGLLHSVTGTTTRLRWRTSTPLALVATVARVAPSARELRVQPVPLRDVLAALSDPREVPCDGR